MQRPIILLALGMGASLSFGEIITIDRVMIDGFQPVPPSGSLATGLASVLIDTVSRDITIEGSFEGLEGDVLSAHLHGPADIGQSSGLILFSLLIEGDFMRSGTFSANRRLSSLQLAVVLNERSYINIHSLAYPSGEIRGQVIVPAPGGLGMLAMSGLFVTRRRR